MIPVSEKDDGTQIQPPEKQIYVKKRNTAKKRVRGFPHK
jgi:hypothetical protein